MISSTICHPSAVSGGVPECLGYKLKCVELHRSKGWIKQFAWAHGLTEGDKISPSQFCWSFTYPVNVKWLAETVWPVIISGVGLAPLIPFNLQNNNRDPSVLLQMLSVSSVPTEWLLL